MAFPAASSQPSNFSRHSMKLKTILHLAIVFFEAFSQIPTFLMTNFP